MIKKVLAVALGLSSAIPLYAGILSMVRNDLFLQMFHVSPSQDTVTMSIYFGISILMIAGLGGLGVAWLLRGKPEGVTLAGRDFSTSADVLPEAP